MLSDDLSPVIADSEEGEDTGGDTHVGDKVVEAAVEGSEEPDPGIDRARHWGDTDTDCLTGPS